MDIDIDLYYLCIIYLYIIDISHIDILIYIEYMTYNIWNILYINILYIIYNKILCNIYHTHIILHNISYNIYNIFIYKYRYTCIVT